LSIGRIELKVSFRPIQKLDDSDINYLTSIILKFYEMFIYIDAAVKVGTGTIFSGRVGAIGYESEGLC
jgi:hypothetical protein